MSFPALESLIAPMGYAKFAEEIQGKRFFHFNKADHDLQALVNWSDFNSILNQQVPQLRYPVIRLIRDGKVIPEKKVSVELSSRRRGRYLRISPEKIK